MILLGRCIARRIHRPRLGRADIDGIARGAEIQQHRAAVGAQPDIGRLDVQMQQAAAMHLAEAVKRTAEHLAHERLGQPAAMAADVVAQGLPGFEAHDQVDRFVGAEEIQHAHHVRMVEPGQRAPLLEEQFQAVVEIRLELGGNDGGDLPLAAQDHRIGHVFLDRDRRAGGIVRQIDDRKAAHRKLSLEAVAFKFIACWKRLVVLRKHGGDVGTGYILAQFSLFVRPL